MSCWKRARLRARKRRPPTSSLTFHDRRNNDPSQGPAFFLSTTSLVFLTDAWHLFKFLELTFTAIFAIALLRCFKGEQLSLKLDVVILLAFKIVRGCFFEVFWEYVWV